MAAASLVGLGLVMLSVSVLSSLVLCGVLSIGASRLRALGPLAERRAATLALLLPPLFGLGLAATISAEKLTAYAAGLDHCLEHAHHLHLCLIHGANWTSTPWAVATITLFGVYVFIRIGQAVWAHVNAQMAATRLKHSGNPIAGFERTFLVPSDNIFAFTTGVFSPIVIISSAAWEALDEGQRTALIAHEHAHIANNDLRKRVVLGLLACCGIPVLSQNVMKRWELASERACDRDAVTRVGKPSVVASTILLLARSQTRSHAPAVSVFAADCHVTDRVQYLFRQPEGDRLAARRLVVALMPILALIGMACVRYVGPLHHAFETILG